MDSNGPHKTKIWFSLNSQSACKDRWLKCTMGSFNMFGNLHLCQIYSAHVIIWYVGMRCLPRVSRGNKEPSWWSDFTKWQTLKLWQSFGFLCRPRLYNQWVICCNKYDCHFWECSWLVLQTPLFESSDHSCYICFNSSLCGLLIWNVLFWRPDTGAPGCWNDPDCDCWK